MSIENIIKALEHQRNTALTQNVELMARVFDLEATLQELMKKSSAEASEVPDEQKKN